MSNNFLVDIIINTINKYADNPSLLYVSKDTYKLIPLITDMIVEKNKNIGLEIILYDGSNLEKHIALKNMYRFKVGNPTMLANMAITVNNKDLLDYAIYNSMNKINFNVIAKTAIEYGNRDLFNYIIEYGVGNLGNLNDLALYAFEYNRFDILYDLINAGANNFNELALFAAQYDESDIVIDMINRGANNLNNILEIAEDSENFYIVRYLENIIGTDNL